MGVVSVRQLRMENRQVVIWGLVPFCSVCRGTWFPPRTPTCDGDPDPDRDRDPDTDPDSDAE
jgi:hypothetical protein